VRSNFGAGSYGHDTTEDGIRYRATLKAGAGLLTFDLHPFAGTFRLSAGLGLNRTRVDFRAVPVEGTLTLGERVYSASDVCSLCGRLRFTRTPPYLGRSGGAAPRPARRCNGSQITVFRCTNGRALDFYNTAPDQYTYQCV
jgi:hypothetical protein